MLALSLLFDFLQKRADYTNELQFVARPNAEKQIKN